MTRPQAPTLYRRKYSDGDEVSFRDLRKAYKMAASLVAKQGDDYLPIFERLDKEIEERQHKEDVRAKAFEVAERDQNPAKDKNKHFKL